MMDANSLGMKNFIKKKGTDIRIYTRYRLAQSAQSGSKTLTLKETFGIFPKSSFQIGPETITVVSVSGNVITLVDPLYGSYDSNVYITNNSNQKGLPAPTYQRITQDYLEYTRKIRLPKDTLINYGSEVEYEGKKFYVVGIDSDQTSLGVKLREVNIRLTIAREVQGVFNGFSYEKTITPIYENIEGHCEYLTSNMLMTEAGYNPSTISYITIPEDCEVQFTDILTVGTVKYRITGMDPYKFKNMINLVVDYENTK